MYAKVHFILHCLWLWQTCHFNWNLDFFGESQNFIINNSLFLKITWGFLVAQTVNHLPTMQENRVQSLRQDDPLEKGMAPHSRFLTGESPWTEEPGGLQSTGLQRVGHD